jgi:hypothetical protein
MQPHRIFLQSIIGMWAFLSVSLVVGGCEVGSRNLAGVRIRVNLEAPLIQCLEPPHPLQSFKLQTSLQVRCYRRFGVFLDSSPHGQLLLCHVFHHPSWHMKPIVMLLGDFPLPLLPIANDIQSI